jgi:hypothetical protein
MHITMLLKYAVEIVLCNMSAVVNFCYISVLIIFGLLTEIRQQLNEQLRCLDQRFEAHYCMVWELQDFYQRRAEVELEYARNLDKLVKQIMMRHRTEKQR